ncbi:MAG: hypothetical protein US57_C0003G0016 [Candidatus Moranbacteria bacterium GW2011_GWC2_37_73]|nr:MAG: hypothetical protein UR95_C0003G0043 [Parcubacteria group bacterium GW2011_GWC1_36_108]KKQ01254.1 MAG: hypothetical protein US09_C0001G0014 [Candidatus Moranbacteria bacterium GW2011_GWD1_36_198]KKQ02313.1 MAG: hypothetical protein US10_C0003G0014 [Candidatus Moranbacteria bacterium GW2011_GWD2_36_198]KKQ40208.1 MAG: hypothetical protein US57_C0003G0016 [Candidatus Moranbacteria bacterium GW2011_GWC2_37_73]HAR99710.1 hypothetical protein [Candidatus Moranbacteria bacterium]
MKEMYQPSQAEIKKAEDVMTEEQKLESMTRENAVHAGEASFSDYDETKKINPEKTHKIEIELQATIYKEFNDRVKELVKSYTESLSALKREANYEDDEQLDEIDKKINELTKKLFEDFGEQYMRLSKVVIDTTITISDFVIHKKDMLLQQEEDQQKRQELEASILKSENAKIQRAEAVIANLEKYINDVKNNFEKGAEELMKEIKK